MKKEFNAYSENIIDLNKQIKKLKTEHQTELYRVTESIETKKRELRDSFISQKNIIINDYEAKLKDVYAPDILEPIFAHGEAV